MAGGDNIKVDEGTYIVVYDPANEKITVNNAKKIWSVIGVNGDWNTDYPMTETMPGIWMSDVIEVTISNLMTYGAFAHITDDVDGLIHISQISDKRIGKPSDELSVGQVVTVKITKIDDEQERVSLSLRAVSEDMPESGDAQDEPDDVEDEPEETEN